MRSIKNILALGLILIAGLTGSVYGDDSAVRVRLDGKDLNMTAPPIIRDGHTYLPLRDVFGLFGFESGWDDASKTATGVMKDFKIEIPVGGNTSVVGGIKTPVDAPAFIEDGRTYVPLRFISETIGAEVLWDGARRLVTLTRNPLEKELDLNDPYMNALLLSLAGKPAGSELTVQDVRFTTHLDLTGQKVSRLDGVEQMPWLQALKAGNNSITQLGPLNNLIWLKHLELQDNLIKTTYELKKLKNLEYLDLSNNELDSLNGLENLLKLRTLSLGGNGLDPEKDFGPAYFLNSALITGFDRSIWEMPDYDTWNLRWSAEFSVPITENVRWVPASAAGPANHLNEDIGEVLDNAGVGKASDIRSVYDLAQFLENWSFEFAQDDQFLSDTKESRKWVYHRSPESALQIGSGSLKALHAACAFTLQNDYQESGVLVMVNEQGSEQYVNFVFDGSDYYTYNPAAYLPQNRLASAVEDGDLETYKASEGLHGNVHQTKSLEAFAKAFLGKDPALLYKIHVLDRDGGQYPSAVYENNRGSGEAYYFLPKDPVAADEDDQENYWSQRFELLHDDAADALRFRWVENPLESPSWK